MRWLMGVIALIALVVLGVLLLEMAGAAPAAWGRATAWILERQRAFHGALTAAMKAIAERPDASTAGWLVAASAFYGVFHAAGPGHGKVVLSGWLLARRHHLGRGVALAIASAFVQGLVAIAIVYGLVELAGWLPRETSSAVDWSERASFALVALIGIVLLARTTAAAVRRIRHDRDHVHGPDCGHVHVPGVDLIDRAVDPKAAVGVVLSIGLRPCTGAIVVLVFARALDMPWAGIAAVVAMSAGTAATVALLAVLVVVLRDRARSLAAGDGASLALATEVLGLVGGVILVAVGVSLLASSFAPPHPLGF